MKIIYKPSVNEVGSRKVYVNDEYFTELHMNEGDKSLFTDKEHPYVNLARIFTEVLSEEAHFSSSLSLHIEIKIL